MPIAYEEPNKEEQIYILSGMPDVSLLDAKTKELFKESLDSLLIFFETYVREATKPMGSNGQNHYLAIRSLNTPSAPKGYDRRVQLVGQEYFGINRFFPSLVDIADIEYWALWEKGDWMIHNRSSDGEHFEVGNSGKGDFINGYLKINGQVLTPEE